MTRKFCAGLLWLLPWTACAQGEGKSPTIDWGDLRLQATGNYAYDFNRSRDQSAQATRRKEFGARLTAKERWSIFIYHEFQTHRWLDFTFTAQTTWLFGKNLGRLRVGHSRVPFGFESLTGSRSRSFIELALPMQAFFQNRRTGLDWSLQREHYLVELGFYPLGDLHGDNDGRTWDARVAWIPRRAHDKVWHIGASWSEERLASRTDGRGQRTSPSVRWQARPEVGLLATRLIDTGTIDRIQAIRRAGLEALWIDGPFSLQAEYLDTRTRRYGMPSFTGRGYYVFGSYFLTGGPRPYRGGQVDNPDARNSQAVELLLRYSALDLNDGAIAGGGERNMTLGANWYPNAHWKLQINQIFAQAKRRGVRMNDSILALQVQFHF